MLFRQKKALATVRTIQVFLDKHDDKLNPVNKGGARTALNEVVTNLESLGGQQDPTRFQRKKELSDELTARDALLDTHMLQIGRVADLQFPQVQEFAYLRVPPKSTDTTALTIWAEEMAKAAEPHQQIFIQHGLPEDFLAQLRAALDNVKKLVGERFVAFGARTGATKMLHAETKRAMGVIGVVDSQITPLLAGNVKVLQEWLVTKRVAKRAVAAAAAETAQNGGDPPAPPVPVTPPSPVVPPVPVAPPAPSEPNAGSAPAKEKARGKAE